MISTCLFVHLDHASARSPTLWDALSGAWISRLTTNDGMHWKCFSLCAVNSQVGPTRASKLCRCIALCNLSAAAQNSMLRKYSHLLNDVGSLLRPHSRDNMSLSFFVEIGGQVCLGTQWWEVPECPGISALVCRSCPNTIDLGTKATHIKT